MLPQNKVDAPQSVPAAATPELNLGRLRLPARPAKTRPRAPLFPRPSPRHIASRNNQPEP